VVCVRDERKLYTQPAQAICVEEWDLAEVEQGDVLVKLLAAPVHPSDINVLQGTYGVKPQLPISLGFEAVGEVVETHPGGKLAVGTKVIVVPNNEWQGKTNGKVCWGAWCSQRIVVEKLLLKVPDSVPLHQAAMARINPVTAYRLLQDFVKLKPGDWVMQNAANGAVGMCVIQIAHEMGLRTINIVRPQSESSSALLKSNGADVVITTKVPLAHTISQLTEGAPVLLALNAVGGKSASDLAAALSPHGTMVTYGSISQENFTINNAHHIFQDKSYKGFWLQNWESSASEQEIADTYTYIFDLMKAGKLHMPVQKTYPLQEAPQAVQHALSPLKKGKILFVA